MRQISVLLVVLSAACELDGKDSGERVDEQDCSMAPHLILNSFEDGTHWAVGSGSHDGNLTVEILADDVVVASDVMEDPDERRLNVKTPDGWTTPRGAFVMARVTGTCGGERFVRKEESTMNPVPFVGTRFPILSAESGCDTREPLVDGYHFVFRHEDGEFYGMPVPGAVFLCRDETDISCDLVDTSEGMYIRDDPSATLDGNLCTATFDLYDLLGGSAPTELRRSKLQYVYSVTEARYCGKHPENPLAINVVVQQQTCVVSQSWYL